MIREAKLEDIPRMVEMGQRFRRESSYNAHLTDNPACMAKLAQKLVEQHSVLIAQRNEGIVGMLGYVIYEHFMSGDKLVGEVFWWVEPEHRAWEGPRMLNEMKKRAKASGAKFYQMIAPNDKVAQFYEAIGCKWVEATYQGVL